ncbi:unnamed protein product, partial [Rotaria sordida]
AALDEFNLNLERTNNLITYRINAVFDEITRIPLCDLPEDEPITPGEFLQHTQELCNYASKQIQIKSHHVEDAVLEVIDLLCGDLIDKNGDGDLQVQYSNVDLDFDNDESDGENTSVNDSNSPK